MRRTASLVALSALLVLAPVAGAGVAPAQQPTSLVQSAAYRHALGLGVRAYVYGYPLLDTNRVFLSSTSTNLPNGAGAGPVNRFSNIRRLTGPSDKTVVAPNHDTLYSIAWLSLGPQPVVVHMPAVRRRFVVFELIDPYTENFANIGSVGLPPGNYAVTAPGWSGRLPTGVRRIRSPYTRVWIIGRTYIRNAADTPNVVRVQNEFSITPLNRWGTGYRPARPKHVRRGAKEYTVPGTGPGQNPLAFFDALGDQLARFPPPAADRPLLRQLATVGIGSRKHPSTDPRLSAAVRQGLHDAVAAGARQVGADLSSMYATNAPRHNGWLVARTGSYGTNYAARAVVDKIGLGAPVSQLAMYPFTITDSQLHPLSGVNRYVAHIPARDLPFPAKAFWSLTLYDSTGFFVPNSAHVYLLGNRSGVRINPDGSLDLYIQPRAPSSAAARRNWLPSPAGRPFRLILRLYEPVGIPGILSGSSWQPPVVLPCLANGMTAAGTRCAG